MIMSYSCLLFDLDGTLVDSLADLATSMNLLRGELGYEALASDAVAQATGDGVGLLVARCLPEREQKETYVERFLAIYAQHLLDQTVPYPGIVELLEQCVDMPLAVVTNKPLEEALAILEGTGLRRFFPVVVGGECAVAKKPAPEPLLLALERLGKQAGGALMIGDHHTDLRSGQQAGCATCFCAWGLGHRDQLESDLEAESPAHLADLLHGQSRS